MLDFILVFDIQADNFKGLSALLTLHGYEFSSDVVDLDEEYGPMYYRVHIRVYTLEHLKNLIKLLEVTNVNNL